MTDLRRWLAVAASGVVGGLLAGLYWEGAHRWNAGCETHACWFPFYLGLWLIGAALLPAVVWLLLLLTGYRSGPRALLVATSGAAIFLVGVRAYVSYVYGSPRPPYAVLALLAAAAFLAAECFAAGPRCRRLLAGAGVVLLLAGLIVGEIGSPRRDRLHRFTELSAVVRLPDPARWRVRAAEAYPHYGAIELSVEPTVGGVSVVLLELMKPGTWDPPRRCGPSLVARRADIGAESAQPAEDTTCAPYPEGGWQRVHPNGAVELIDVQDGALVITGSQTTSQPVPAQVQRQLLTDLRPATPEIMADLNSP